MIYSISHYDDAVQSLKLKFNDQTIKAGFLAEKNMHGLPIPYSGANACVYKLRAGGEIVALRFFLRLDSHTQNRYSLLDDFFKRLKSDYFVPFEYQKKGVLIEGKWLPLIKMPWINGLTLDKYIESKLDNKILLGQLLAQFCLMMRFLKENGIAHGDLQHGNILVSENKLKLVDYDGLFCSETQNAIPNEIGLPNYQHISRVINDYTKDVDNFSAWIIFISIKILIIDPTFFRGNEILVFERKDFENVKISQTFQRLLNHPNQEIKNSAIFIKSIVDKRSVSEVPLFDERVSTFLVATNNNSTEWWQEEKKKVAPAGTNWIDDWSKKKPWYS
jgi:serine/threonine protein kinase